MDRLLMRQFAVRKPCANCPFRNDGRAIELSPGRRREIIDALMAGVPTFFCHKTTGSDSGPAAHCAGAIAVLRRLNTNTTVVQVAERLGVIPPNHYDEAIPLVAIPGPND